MANMVIGYVCQHGNKHKFLPFQGYKIGIAHGTSEGTPRSQRVIFKVVPDLVGGFALVPLDIRMRS